VAGRPGRDVPEIKGVITRNQHIIWFIQHLYRI
jgi:hypothetical protein